MLSSGWKIHGDVSKVVMTNGSEVLTFDIVINTTKGALFYASLKRVGAAIVGANAELTKSMSIDKAHQIFSTMPTKRLQG